MKNPKINIEDFEYQSYENISTQYGIGNQIESEEIKIENWEFWQELSMEFDSKNETIEIEESFAWLEPDNYEIIHVDAKEYFDDNLTYSEVETALIKILKTKLKKIGNENEVRQSCRHIETKIRA